MCQTCGCDCDDDDCSCIDEESDAEFKFALVTRQGSRVLGGLLRVSRVPRLLDVIRHG
jgi:hypothetical protein